MSGTSRREASALADVFERLFKSYRSEIFRTVLRSSRNRQDAEDLTQITFLNAYAALQRGAAPEAPRAWLHAIARNAGSRRFRQARLVEVELDAETAPALEEDPTAIDELQWALARLTFNQRASLLMREVGGLSAREIGARLGISPGAVATLLFRARRALRAELDASVEKPTTTSRLRVGVLYATVLRPLWTRLAGPIFDGSEALSRSAAAVGVVAAAVGVAVFTGTTGSPSAPADHVRAAVVAARADVVVPKSSRLPVARAVRPAPVPVPVALLPHVRIAVRTAAAEPVAHAAKPVAVAPRHDPAPNASGAEPAAAPAPAQAAAERAPAPETTPAQPGAEQQAASPSASAATAAPRDSGVPQPVQAAAAPVVAGVSRALPSTSEVTGAAPVSVPDTSQLTNAVPVDGSAPPSAPPVPTDVAPPPVAPPPLPAPPTGGLPTG